MEITGKILKTSQFSEYPELEVNLKLPDNTWSPEITLTIDTGYTGDVMLNPSLFAIWSQKMERMSDDAEVAESITGELLTLQSVDTFIKLGEDTIFQIVMSSHSSINENLIGWNVLKDFISVFQADRITILDGK